MPVNFAEKKFFDLLEAAAQTADQPVKPLEDQTIEEFRVGASAFAEFTGKPADISYKNDFVPARDCFQIPIRIYNNTLHKNSPVLIFFPGCGYVLDWFEINAIACSRIAKYAGVKVIVVNFRLAPEYPLPTSIHDGFDATQYIAKHADHFGIDPHRIFIGGLSSGGHCAATVSNLISHEKANNTTTLYHQILLNGCYDLTQSNHEYDDFEKEDKICSREAVDFLFKQYGIEQTDYKNPLFSPYYETNLTSLPSTSIIIGEYDGIRNDSEAYYKKLKEAGNLVEKIILPGQTHNTIVLRETMSDGEDPAKTIADIITRKLSDN